MSEKRSSNYILRFACFLTFTNFILLLECSEVSKQKILKYFSGLIVISIIWFLVGFGFIWLYIEQSLLWSLLAGVLSVIIVLQVERQIIVGEINFWKSMFRIFIGFLLAFLGAIVTDQFLFANDIELMKQTPEYKATVKKSVSVSLDDLEQRKEYFKGVIDTLDIRVDKLEREKAVYSWKDVSNSVEVDSFGDTISSTRKENRKSFINTNRNLIPKLLERKYALELKIDSLDSVKSIIEANQQRYYESNKGILSELKLLKKAVLGTGSKSEGDWYIGLILYMAFFFLFFTIELFILFTKLGEPKTDYDELIRFQKKVKIKRIKNLDV